MQGLRLLIHRFYVYLQRHLECFPVLCRFSFSSAYSLLSTAFVLLMMLSFLSHLRSLSTCSVSFISVRSFSNFPEHVYRHGVRWLVFYWLLFDPDSICTLILLSAVFAIWLSFMNGPTAFFSWGKSFVLLTSSLYFSIIFI